MIPKPRPWTLAAFLAGLAAGVVGTGVFRHQGGGVTRDVGHEAAKAHATRSDDSESLEIRNLRDRRRALIDLAARMGSTDPTAGWEHGLGLRSASDRVAYMEALVRSWAIKNPEEALSKAGELGLGHLKTECLASACGGWASKDPLAAAKWVESNLTGPSKTESSAAIAASWAESSPEEATAWAGNLPAGTAAEAALSKALEAWVDSDPTSAAQWAASQPEGEKRSTALLELAVEWSDEDPAAASQWIASQAGTEDGGEMVDTLLNRWSQDDPAAAANWVRSLPEDKQANANAMVLAVWAADDPASASAWATAFPSGETRTEAIPALAEAWAGIDPKAAVSWSLALPDSPEKSEAVDQSVRTWSLSHRDELTAWINSQPVGSGSDHLRSTASIVIAEHHPLEGATMAAAISDPAQRQDSIVDVVRQWRKTDPKAANAWISQQTIDLATRHRLEP